MCIVCDAVDDTLDRKASDAGDKFLGQFEQSMKLMEDACDSMLLYSKNCVPEYRPHYDAFHKKMVKVRREWCRLEKVRNRKENPHA